MLVVGGSAQPQVEATPCAFHVLQQQSDKNSNSARVTDIEIATTATGVARGCTSTECHLQVALKQLQQAAALFKEALLDSPDDWTSLQQYLDCMLPQSSEADGDVSDPQASGDESESRTTGDDPQLERRMLQLQVQDKQQVQPEILP